MDPDLPRRAVATFEALTGLTLSLHDHSGMLAPRLSGERTEHRNPWCRAVKAVAQGACTRFCARSLHTATDDGAVACTRCHAGLVQWVVSGVSAGRPVWLLFAGVRQAAPDLAIDIHDPAEPKYMPAWLAGPSPPPPSGDGAVMAEALAQLNLRLLHWFEASRGESRAPRRRTAAIRDFIRANQGKPIRLADLARHLGLSPDRARHAVREACGSGFARLLAEERLATAAQLLRHTDLPVAEVASRSGFGSVAHFHACFRARWRMTPAAMRRATPT
jgi:AraC-like DNA-binding protein